MAKINNPTLFLTFLGEDIQAGHNINQEISSENIVYHSISFRYQLLNNLKSSSNQITMQLTSSTCSIEDIVVTNGDIKAVLKDGSITLFTGFLSTNYSWSVTQTGESALNITLEDVGTRLLSKTFSPNGEFFFNTTAYQAIFEICKVAKISISKDCIALTENIVRTVDSSKTCKDLLDQILYEVGCVYYFDEFGHLLIYKIDCITTDNIRVLDKDNLYCVGSSAINLTKNVRTYNGARVTFTRLGRANDYLIYRNTTGQGDGHPYCYFSLKSGEHFDGTGIYDSSSWVDTFRIPTIVKACNAESETSVVGSNEIVSVDNVRSILKAQSGSIEATITKAGGANIIIDVVNNGSLSYYITRLDALGDITFIKDTNLISTEELNGESNNSQTVLKQELNFIHTREQASKFANLITQYHKYANAKYTFYSKVDLENGSIIKLIDNIHSGLVVNVLVFAKEFTDQSEVIKYTAVGISKFDLAKETFYQSIANSQTDKKGADGSSFTTDVESSNGSLFRPNSVDTVLSCKVLKNNLDITNELEDYRFKWIRKTDDALSDEIWNTSSKALNSKTLIVNSSDCIGRTVFNCEVDLKNL